MLLRAHDSNSRWVSLSANGNPGGTPPCTGCPSILPVTAATASISGSWVPTSRHIFLNGANTGITRQFRLPDCIQHRFGFRSGVNTLDSRFRISPADGVPGGRPGGYRRFAGCPEPSTWALLIIGSGRSARRRAAGDSFASREALAATS